MSRRSRTFRKSRRPLARSSRSARRAALAALAPLAPLALVALALAAPPPAAAHHGRDFLLSQSAELPHPGQVFLVSRQDYADAGTSFLELEPAVLVGLGERLAFEIHGHAGREQGGDFEYESTAPALHLLLTPHHSPWGLVLSAEYEFAHGGGDHAEADHDDEVAAATAPLLSIGDHHEAGEGDDDDHHDEEGDAHVHRDNAAVRLSASSQLRGFLVAANVLASEEQTSGADVQWGYTAGLRHALGGRGWAWGLEAQGDLEGDDGHEGLLGLYYEPSQAFAFNVGLGAGFGDSELDYAVRTSLVWRVH